MEHCKPPSLSTDKGCTFKRQLKPVETIEDNITTDRRESNDRCVEESLMTSIDCYRRNEKVRVEDLLSKIKGN